MRTKVTLVLIFLNVALFFFIFKFERNWRTEAASLETRRRVLGPEAADIRTLEITHHADNTTFRLERTRDTWFLTEPLNWPANPHAASSIVHELQLLKNETSFSVADLALNRQSLADYGLEKPKLTVAFTSGDPAGTPGVSRPTTRLDIGDTTGDGKRLYVLSPDQQRIHVVNRSLVDTLSVPLEQLRAETLLSVRVFEARSLSLQTASADLARPGSSGVRVRIRRDGTRWTFETPVIARASKTAVELVINELNALQPKTFDPATRPAALPSESPRLRIMIEGNNRHETLFLGEQVRSTPPAAGATPTASVTPPSGSPTAPATKAGEEYYAQLDGREALFTVVMPTALIESLRNAQESVREKRILDFDPATVSAITIAAPIQPNQAPITLQRLESAPGQTREAEQAWQLVYRSDGAQSPQTSPAETTEVRRLLERLTLLTAEQFKSDAPTSADLEDWGFNRPLRQVTLAFSGNTPPLVLRIGTDATRTVTYARVGTATDPGASIYAVNPAILRALDLSPNVWRNRAAGEPLPASARVSALTLKDLAENRALAELTLTPTGAPTDPGRDPKAVAAVVAALRNLRAKDFVSGGFTERVAPNDAPWRFQLDAAISSPGLAGLEQTRIFTLLLTERLSGSQQFAGSKELDMVFSLDQGLVDALWSLAYGERDPGPPPAPKQ